MGILRRITPSNVTDIIGQVKHAAVVGLDTETTALHPKDGKIRLIQLAIPGKNFILDCFQFDPKILLPLFDGLTRFVGHNLGFDLRFLMSVGLEVPHGRSLFDTMIAGQLLDAGIFPRPSHSLANMVMRYFGKVLAKEGQTSDWSGNLEDWQLQYAARDAEILLPLHDLLMQLIQEANLTRTMNLEMRALPGVAWFTYSGIPIDKSKWNSLALHTGAQAEQLEYALAQQTQSTDVFGWSQINWRSPLQVQKEFNDRFLAQGRTTKEKVRVECCLDMSLGLGCSHPVRSRTIEIPYTISDTGDETLSALAADGDELAQLLLKYRKYGKLRDTYGFEWGQKHIHADGRVYADYRQCGPYSGRMACGDPNIQQIPHSKEYRSCFIAPDGEVFVISDYSQIELRLTVDVTRDPVGMQAYCVNNTDLHRSTAELILGVDLKDTSPENLARIKEARQVAKSLNFGLIYGAGYETMRRYALSAFGVNLSREEAQRLRQLWRDTYKGIVAWQRRVRDGVEIVYTVGGRRRLNVDKFTEKLNTPIQGAGADGLKAAIALCWERRHLLPSGVKPAALVHDEIGMTSRDADGLEVGEWLKYNMETGMQNFMNVVPVVAEPVVAKSWADK